VTAADVKAALRRRHGAENATGMWVCVDEAFCGWRSAGGGIDLLAIGVWDTAHAAGLSGVRSCQNPVVSYEVKVSRADMRRELYGYTPGPNTSWRTRGVPPWPHKAGFALQRSHYFLFAVPRGLLKPHELERREPWDAAKDLWVPPNVGLVEVEGDRCKAIIAAPRLDDPPPLRRGEIAELIRHAVDPNQLRLARERITRLEGEVVRLNELLREAEYA
jgi:hypothetical protein